MFLLQYGTNHNLELVYSGFHLGDVKRALKEAIIIASLRHQLLLGFRCYYSSASVGFDEGLTIRYRNGVDFGYT